MSWRVVVVSGVAKLDLKMGFLVVRKETTTRVHLSEIHTLIIDSTAISMTTALLNEMLHKKIKIVFCDETHNPAGELLPYHGSHDSSLRVKMQIAWSKDIRESVWTCIVAEKIRKQREVLAQNGLNKEAALLDLYLTQLEKGDTTNREAHAAKVYFDALFGMDFTRSEDSVTNSALNYGYSILMSSFNKEIAACGYLSELGIFHDNRFNPFNLAGDLMEPFRPLVDRLVFERHFEVLGNKEKMTIVDLLNSQVHIAGSIQRLLNAIRIYSKSVFEALNMEDVSQLRFYSYELPVHESDRVL